MRTIIAGSRQGVTKHDVYEAVARSGYRITTVVSGTAAGADTFGEQWAEDNGIEIARFPADWAKHGKKAGHLRNAEMAKFADALILVWDGASRGSANMLATAQREGLRTFAYVPLRLACRHCEWGIGGCTIHPDRWPNATPLTCASFYRAPGSDDDLST